MRAGEDLLDVNVLLSLAWPSHLHHGIACEWFERNSGSGWATCSITELGFIRLSANPKVFADAVSPGEARLHLEAMKRLGRHNFWPDSCEPTGMEQDLSRQVVTHRQVTDGHLLQMARTHGGRLISFDQRMRTLLPAQEVMTRLLVLS